MTSVAPDRSTRNVSSFVGRPAHGVAAATLTPGIELMRTRPGQVLLLSDRGNIAVNVADSGIGLDPANRERIFDTFFTTKPEGMGMGLAISNTIIEAHRGRLWAESGSPFGAVFAFTLPLVAGAGS